MKNRKTRAAFIDYFNKRKNQKAFAIAPFNSSKYRYAWGKKDVEWAINDCKLKGLVLFAVNDTFVYKANLQKFLSTPYGKACEFWYKAEYLKAIDECKKMILQGEDKAFALRLIAQNYRYLSDFAKAKEYFEKSEKIKSNVYNKLGIAECLLQESNYIDAQKVLDDIRCNYPSSSKKSVDYLELSLLSSLNKLDDVLRIEGNKPVIGCRLKDSPKGIQVCSVLPHSPAFKAGLKNYDIIKIFNGINLEHMAYGDLIKLGRATKFGKVESLLVLRKGKMLNINMINGYTKDLAVMN